jgi:hypothetical protein
MSLIDVSTFQPFNLSTFPVTDRRSAPSRVLLSTSFDSSMRLAIDIENDTPYSMTRQGKTKKRRIVDRSISRCPIPMLMQLIVHLCSKSVWIPFVKHHHSSLSLLTLCTSLDCRCVLGVIGSSDRNGLSDIDTLVRASISSSRSSPSMNGRCSSLSWFAPPSSSPSSSSTALRAT